MRKKKSLNIVFWSDRKNFVVTQKQHRISHGKQTIGVRPIEVRMYIVFDYFKFDYLIIFEYNETLQE